MQFDSTNIHHVNDCLGRMNMPQINPAQHARLIASIPRERLDRAFPLAADQKNMQAIQFIKVEVDKLTGAVQAPAQPPAPQLPASAVYPQETAAPQAPAPSPEMAPPSPAPVPQASPDAPESKKREYVSKHVYGGSAALCFDADETKQGVPTIAIDAAAGSNRQFDWNTKVRIQLTEQELPVVAAVLFGMLPGCSFKNHGVANDKGFEVQHQGGKIFIKVFAKDKGVKAVPVSPSDVYAVASLFIRQLQKASPWMDAQTIIATLGHTVARMMSTPPTQ